MLICRLRLLNNPEDKMRTKNNRKILFIFICSHTEKLYRNYAGNCPDASVKSVLFGISRASKMKEKELEVLASPMI